MTISMDKDTLMDLLLFASKEGASRALEANNLTASWISYKQIKANYSEELADKARMSPKIQWSMMLNGKRKTDIHCPKNQFEAWLYIKDFDCFQLRTKRNENK